MIILQIKIEQKLKTLNFDFDILKREDAKEQEIEIAKVIEGVHIAALKKISKDAGVKVKTRKVKEA